jgi:hypothetical protein
VLVSAAVSSSEGCVDLDVTNPNEADRDRVLSSAQDVQSLISTSYQAYFDNAQQTNPGMPTGAMADNLTGGFFDFGVHDMTTIPRERVRCEPAEHARLRRPRSLEPPVSGALQRQRWAPRHRWRAADHDRVAMRSDGTRPAFGKFMQGITHGYLALYYDQALIVTEDHGSRADGSHRLPPAHRRFGTPRWR